MPSPFFPFSLSAVEVTPARRMPDGSIRRAGFVRPSRRYVKVPKQVDETGRKLAETHKDPIPFPPQTPPQQPPSEPPSAPQQQHQSKTKEDAKKAQAATKEATSALQGQSTTKPLGSVTPEKSKGTPSRQAQPASEQSRSGGPPGKPKAQVAAPQVQPKEKKAAPDTPKAPEQKPSEAPSPKRSILKTPKKRVVFATPLEQFSEITEEQGGSSVESSTSSYDSFTDPRTVARRQGQAPSESSSSSSYDSYIDPLPVGKVQGGAPSESSSSNDSFIGPRIPRTSSTPNLRKGSSNAVPSQAKGLANGDTPRPEKHLPLPNKRPEPALSAPPAKPSSKPEKRAEFFFTPKIVDLRPRASSSPATYPSQRISTPPTSQQRRGDTRIKRGSKKYVPPTVRDEGKRVDR